MMIKKMNLFILIICIAILTASCSPKEEISTSVEVDLSNEMKIIEAFGLVKAEESKDIIIDFPAVIQDVLVEEGQSVGLHEPILTLDLSQYQSQILDKKNELNIAKLEYQKINKNLKGLSLENKEAEINKLMNDLDYSKQLYEQAVEVFQSNEMLYEAGAISQEVLNEFKRNVDEAQNNIEAIQFELQQATSRNKREVEEFSLKQSTEKDQVHIQNERILQIENNLLTLEDKLKKPFIVGNQIVSEFETGAVYNITYAPGHLINSTQKAFSIANLESLVVEANVIEEFIRDVKVGATVKIVPIADRTKEYEGKVIYIAQMAFPNNGQTVVPVRISIDNIDSFLLPNFNVDVYIDVQ